MTTLRKAKFRQRQKYLSASVRNSLSEIMVEIPWFEIFNYTGKNNIKYTAGHKPALSGDGLENLKGIFPP